MAPSKTANKNERPLTTPTTGRVVQPSLPPPVNAPPHQLAAANVGDRLYLLPMNQYPSGPVRFLMETVAGEQRKRKAIEASLKQKEKLVEKFRKKFHHYEERTALLEDLLQQRGTREGTSSAAAADYQEEEVESSWKPNNASRLELLCRTCMNRTACMLWLPCRHLCVCEICDALVRVCPICNAPRITSFIVNVSNFSFP